MRLTEHAPAARHPGVERGPVRDVDVDVAIQSDWAHEPNVGEACLLVWCMLTHLGEQQLDHYSFSDIKKLAAEDDESVVAKATMYLSNQRLQVLETCLMYEFKGYFYELPEEEVQHYAKGEEVFHPELGEPIDTSDIVVCFTPGPRLQKTAAR